MKKFYYFLFMLTILALAGLFILKKPNGEPWLTTSEFTQPILNKTLAVKEAISEKIGDWTESNEKEASKKIDDTQSTNVYRWQDENGVWHYSDQASKNKQSTLVAIQKTNTITLPKVEKQTKQNKSITQTNNKQRQADALSKIPGNNRAVSLINNSNNVQELMNNRTNQLDKVLKEQLNQ